MNGIYQVGNPVGRTGTHLQGNNYWWKSCFICWRKVITVEGLFNGIAVFQYSIIQRIQRVSTRVGPLLFGLWPLPGFADPN